MIRVVIDTSVIVSAAFRDRTPEEIVLFVVENAEFDWVVSTAILKEYNDVLSRKKFDLPDVVIEEWGLIFAKSTTLIESDIEIEFPRDQKDAKFIECSLASDAKYLITGDNDYQDAQKFAETIMISASRFRRLVMEKWIDNK